MSKFMRSVDEDGGILRWDPSSTPGLGVATGPDEESLKRFAEYEETIDHLKTDGYNYSKRRNTI